VCKAYAKYKLESNYGARGDIVHWKDPELGDPAFYSAALARSWDRLDGLASWFPQDMTDADVDQLFGPGRAGLDGVQVPGPRSCAPPG